MQADGKHIEVPDPSLQADGHIARHRRLRPVIDGSAADERDGLHATVRVADHVFGDRAAGLNARIVGLPARDVAEDAQEAAALVDGHFDFTREAGASLRAIKDDETLAAILCRVDHVEWNPRDQLLAGADVIEAVGAVVGAFRWAYLRGLWVWLLPLMLSIHSMLRLPYKELYDFLLYNQVSPDINSFSRRKKRSNNDDE